MATYAKDTHATASKAEADRRYYNIYRNGLCPSRSEDAMEGYQTWKQKAEGQ